MDLMPVKKMTDANSFGLPAKSTLYKWKHKRRYPKLLVKIGGQLYFDKAEWQLMVNQIKEEQTEEAKSLSVHP